MKTLHLMISTIMILVISIMMTTNVFAQTNESGPEPQPVKDWLAAHPNFTGCVHGNLKTGEAKEASCFQPGVLPSGLYEPQNNTHVISPLKQFKSGMPVRDVKCKQDFDLVVQINSNFPACVKPTSVQRLVMQGHYLVINDTSISRESGYDRIVTLDWNATQTVCGMLGIQCLLNHPNHYSFPAKIIGPITYVTVFVNDIPHTVMLTQSSSCVFPPNDKMTCDIPLTPQNKMILPNYTNPVLIKNQTIFAGIHGFISCPPLDFWVSSTILNSAGFSGIYTDNRDIDNQDTKDYVLRPGHNGTITLLLTGHFKSTEFPSPPLVITNRSHIKNDSIFLHHEGKVDFDSHPGVDISYTPESEILHGNQTVTVTATISAKQDAPHGDYWVILAPGTCNGGQLLLLTITN